MKYLVMCKVYTDVGGIKYIYHVFPSVRKIIHLLQLVDYLHLQADNPWYNYIVHLTIYCKFVCLFDRLVGSQVTSKSTTFPVMSKRDYLGGTSTKQKLKCPVQGHKSVLR